MTSPAAKKIYSKQCSLNFNANPANPFSLQISSQLVTRGAGGRGEALGYISLNCLALYVVRGAVCRNTRVCKKWASLRALGSGRFLTPL